MLWGRAGVANTSVVDFDSDFVSPWWGNFNRLDAQIFSSLPCNRSLLRLSITALYILRVVTNLAGNSLLKSVSQQLNMT